jgi:hypothetical protein
LRETLYEFSYSVAVPATGVKDLALFTHGYYNAAALLRPPISQRNVGTLRPTEVVTGGGLQGDISGRLARFGCFDAGLTKDCPQILGLFGFPIAL